MTLSLSGTRAPVISEREEVPKRLLVPLVCSRPEWRGSLSTLPRPGGASNAVKIPRANPPRSSIIRYDTSLRASGRAYSACPVTRGNVRAPLRSYACALHVYHRAFRITRMGRAQTHVRTPREYAWYYNVNNVEYGLTIEP